MEVEPKTNFSKSWNEFIKTETYKNLVTHCEMNGMKQPYIDNVFQQVFSSAWHYSGAKIKHLNDYVPSKK